MITVGPGTHPEADEFWKTKLGSKPNGARVLGGAMVRNLADIFENYYDMMVAYACDYPFEIPDGVKKIAVMWHQNYPFVTGFKVWQRVNIKLIDYDVDYYCNEPAILKLIKEGGGKAFYLPRFIDTRNYPVFNESKSVETLWFGNAWGEFQDEFDYYKRTVKKPYWITHGELGLGDKKIRDLNRYYTLQTVAKAKKVWAIGISQLEAQFYGADIVSYRDGILPFYDQNTIREYLIGLLDEIGAEKIPRLRK